jgi:hypothetical protein
MRASPRYRCAVIRRAPLLLGLLVVAWTARPATTAADPLDKVSGMEDWNRAGPENIDAEWKDWYRARVEWRRASRELRIQRAISVRLAPLLERVDAPTPGEIRRVIRTGMGPSPRRAPSPAHPAPSPAPKRRPRDVQPQTPAAAPPGEVVDPTTEETPEPGSWSRVPVERLDKDGQAVDEEGDRELQRSIKRKRK